MRKSGFVVCAGLVFAGICAASCNDATRAVLSISTPAACEEGSGPNGLSITDAVIYIGSSYADLDYNEAQGNAVAQVSCAALKDARKPSTLVLVPNEKNEAFVRVVAGTKSVSASGFSRTPADLCGPNTKGACIRATRQFKYVQHATVQLPIVLHPSCVGSTCKGEETCVEGGSCRLAQCPEGVRDCQGSLLSKSDAGVPPPVDGGQEKLDAVADGPGPFTWPSIDAGALYFTCSNGTHAWTGPCIGGNPKSDDVSYKAFVCQNGAASLCPPPLAKPCCGGKSSQCCLAKGIFHPIDVTEIPPADLSQYCEATPPVCFSKGDCKTENCDFGPFAAAGWGVCVP